MMWNAGMGVNPWMWLFMGLGTVAFWVAVAFVVRSLLGGRAPRLPEVRGMLPQAPGHAAPLDVLQDRLARGEIDVDEYARTRRALVGDDAATGREREPESRR